jgi:hypothetical protein
MPELNGLLRQGRSAAGGALRLGTWPLRAGAGVIGGLLRGDPDDDRVEATAPPRMRSARKPPTRPPQRANRPAARQARASGLSAVASGEDR